MALKSRYNGEENKMRMSRIAKPRTSGSGTIKKSAVTGAITGGAGSKMKTATPRTAVLRKSKVAKKRTY